MKSYLIIIDYATMYCRQHTIIYLKIENFVKPGTQKKTLV